MKCQCDRLEWKTNNYMFAACCGNVCIVMGVSWPWVTRVLWNSNIHTLSEICSFSEIIYYSTPFLCNKSNKKTVTLLRSKKYFDRDDFLQKIFQLNLHEKMNQWEMDDINSRSRRYSVSSDREALHSPIGGGLMRFPGTSEDLHAWSIYRQNLNSDFTDSALGMKEKSPLPYGNFQLRESTMASILNNPKYGPKSELGKWIQKPGAAS